METKSDTKLRDEELSWAELNKLSSVSHANVDNHKITIIRIRIAYRRINNYKININDYY